MYTFFCHSDPGLVTILTKTSRLPHFSKENTNFEDGKSSTEQLSLRCSSCGLDVFRTSSGTYNKFQNRLTPDRIVSTTSAFIWSSDIRLHPIIRSRYISV